MLIGSIDLETYATVDLKQTGVYPYAEHPDTEVLCACWRVDNGPVQTWRWGDPPPVLPTGVLWQAYNAQFDATLWYHVLHRRCGWPWPGWEAFRCTMVRAAYANLPGSLGEVAKALQSALKDDAGARIMKTLCRPAHETTTNDDPKRRHTPEALTRLAAYCAQDVVAESALDPLLPQLPEAEERLWHLDQRINRRGVFVDDALVDRLSRVAAGLAEVFREDLARVTGGAVARETALPALASWLRSRGVAVGSGRGSMDRDAVAELLARKDLPPDARKALELRQLLGKSSIAKLNKLKSARSSDGRIRGLLQFYGAHQTGRWAGRLVQPQSMPRGLFEEEADYALALDVLATADREDNPEWMVAMYGQGAMDAIASLIRPCFRAAPDHHLVAADYSAIEARVLAVLANEQWRLEVFRTHGKIYEASAAMIYGVPIEQVTKKQRQVGKVSELASGYQGGPRAWVVFGADETMTMPEIETAVKAWRAASPNVVRFWYDIQDAALDAVRHPGVIYRCGILAFRFDGRHLKMRLPSGRCLWYRDAHIRQEPAPWDENRLLDKLCFYGEDEGGRYGLQSTFGGRLTQNAVQAISRDIMAHAIALAEHDGAFPVVLSVHDELVCELPGDPDEANARALVARMCDLPPWAKGWPIKAVGWTGLWYRK